MSLLNNGIKIILTFCLIGATILTSSCMRTEDATHATKTEKGFGGEGGGRGGRGGPGGVGGVGGVGGGR